jgi:prepilin-type N-terminal cleavage/methylation domain-containing protein
MRARGFTLMEVMLVIALAALLGSAAVAGLSSVRRGQLRESAFGVASMLRRGYVHALTSGRTTRLVIPLGVDRAQLQIEDTDDAHVMDVADPFHASGTAGTSDDAERLARRAADLIASGRPRAPRAEFAAHTDDHDSRLRFLFQPWALKGSVTVTRLYTQHEPDAREQGTGHVYFWPGGTAERAVVQIRNPNGDVFSVVLHALTGRSRIYNHAVDLQNNDEDDTANDQDDVDVRTRTPGGGT